MNVNEPETRGVALALHVVLDDLGKARCERSSCWAFVKWSIFTLLCRSLCFIRMLQRLRLGAPAESCQASDLC